MSYVYERSNGLFEIRYPIPSDVVNYFPKPSGKGFRTHIIKSLGTRDKSVANTKAVGELSAIESMFSVLRKEEASDEFRTFCRVAYEQESELVVRRRLDSKLSQQPYLEEELDLLRNILDRGDLDELEGVAGWLVDFYFESTASSLAVVPTDTPIRNALLTAAAGVLADAYTQANASIRGVSIPPKPKSPLLKAEPASIPSPGDNTPLTPEGHFSLERYWRVYEDIKQSSSSPICPFSNG